MAVLRRSSGTIISSGQHTDYTNRAIVHLGHGNTTTPNDKSFSDVTLLASKDALYLAANSSNPVFTAIDSVSWTPRRFPET